MRRDRQLWYGLVAIAVPALLLLGVALWFDWLSERSYRIACFIVMAYCFALSSLRRFVDPKYAELLAARRAARQKSPAAEETLKGYPKWW